MDVVVEAYLILLMPAAISAAVIGSALHRHDVRRGVTEED